MQYLLIIFASIFVLFLPGFSLSFALFLRGKVDLIERIALSFALSISSVPLFAFYMNLLGVPIRKESVIAETLIIILLGAAVYIYRDDQSLRLPFSFRKLKQ
jgi:uncharacterized membrane protein